MKTQNMYDGNEKDVRENVFVRLFKEWGVPIIAAYILYLIINKLIFFNIQVPTGSMLPTIQLNDRIMVTRVHNTDKLKRGDIIVFESDELNEKLIKRLVGLPNETVEIKEDGSVYINEKKLEESYVVNQVKEGKKYFGMKIGKYEVPEGCYLFLGDNRNNSKDARYWENPYIHEEKIMGKAQYVIFPFNRLGKLK